MPDLVSVFFWVVSDCCESAKEGPFPPTGDLRLLALAGATEAQRAQAALGWPGPGGRGTVQPDQGVGTGGRHFPSGLDQRPQS